MTHDLPPIFVINMAKDTDRRASIQARADEVGLNLTFIEAVNGRALSTEETNTIYDSAKRQRNFGRDMTGGELGCLLSHRNIYDKMIAENIERAIILEDDVIFENDVKEALEAIMISPMPWDTIRFLGSKKIYKRGCRKITPLGQTHYHFARLPTAPGGSHGYFITKRAAQIMRNHMNRLWVPIDTLLGRTWETGIETLVLHPAPLYPDPEADSTIGNDDRFDKTPKLTGVPRLLYPLTRLWYRLTDTLGKRWTYWASWWKDKKNA